MGSGRSGGGGGGDTVHAGSRRSSSGGGIQRQRRHGARGEQEQPPPAKTGAEGDAPPRPRRSPTPPCPSRHSSAPRLLLVLSPLAGVAIGHCRSRCTKPSPVEPLRHKRCHHPSSKPTEGIELRRCR
ncbi:hypothetical protein OsJ_30236 [Oryza sativa Japonica Group]|uniref:Uncharacterized protein n=1 Tax=Oryza sativa subsp. japonica TaxID=39947 RepID=Q69NJ0_ORYSJ|nr:hypothetical protein OsJ_30236 [Oryza sativa Japonica Group]BAD33737.1 hypothetical protein [Oryza sativa Japonica Group]